MPLKDNLQPFKAVRFTPVGTTETWMVELIPGIPGRGDTFIFRPFSQQYHPGSVLVPGPDTTYWRAEDWERWEKRHAEKMSLYQQWFDRCVWLHEAIDHDRDLLTRWGVI